jgi:osmotically-inducible protein OsmY
MRRFIVAAAALTIASGWSVLSARGQEVDEETIRETIERGVSRVGEELRRGWAEVRTAVDKLGVQGRVYGRLHWDKALTDATIDIQVLDDHRVVLKGSVPNARAKTKAVRLTEDTVGVTSVVDELAVFDQ